MSVQTVLYFGSSKESRSYLDAPHTHTHTHRSPSEVVGTMLHLKNNTNTIAADQSA